MSTENITHDVKILQRLREAVEKLGLNKTELAAKTGYSKGQVGWILEGKTNLSPKFVKTFCLTCNISEVWLNEGIGNMIIHPVQYQTTEQNGDLAGEKDKGGYPPEMEAVLKIMGYNPKVYTLSCALAPGVDALPEDLQSEAVKAIFSTLAKLEEQAKERVTQKSPSE